MSGANHETGRLQTVEEKIATYSGDVLVRRYRKGKLLGSGGFANCYEFIAMDTHKHLACKLIPKASVEKGTLKQKLASEIKIHRSLKHPGIVQFVHTFEDNENVYILLELCSTETMSDVLRRRKRLSEMEVQSHVLRLVETLRYLQSRKVVHRDFKLANFFLTEKMEIKLGDFGLAAKLEFEGERRRTICGTPNFIAPEVLDENIGHSFEADIWSLGVVIYTMLVGKPPFETDDVDTTYSRIRANSYTFPDSLSSRSKSLISSILVIDPTQRATLDQILRSEFMNQGYDVPRLVPAYTMSCPLSKSFIDKLRTAEPPKQEEGLADRACILKESPAFKEAVPLPLNSVEVDAPVSTVPDLLPLPLAPPPPCAEAAPVWVVKWMDYSTKFGLGYRLSDQSVGVCFNDLSKMVLDSEEEKLTYVERDLESKRDIIYTFSTQEHLASNIKKKLKILSHFREALEASSAVCGPSDPVIFVKKWVKTKSALLIRFSNNVIQVLFHDKCEVLLSSSTEVITHVNREGERWTCLLEQAQADPGSDLAKRVQLTLELLGLMLGRVGRHSLL